MSRRNLLPSGRPQTHCHRQGRLAFGYIRFDATQRADNAASSVREVVLVHVFDLRQMQAQGTPQRVKLVATGQAKRLPTMLNSAGPARTTLVLRRVRQEVEELHPVRRPLVSVVFRPAYSCLTAGMRLEAD